MSKRTDPEPGKKVAIVGSGCAGLAALWALSRSPHDVYLYEADSRLGGHSNTVEFVKGKYKVMVDTGFIVLNSATYPNFIDFLKLMKVELEPTDMTFSVSRDQGWFEWSGSSVDALFCQRSNLMSPKMWRMIFDIIRFNYFALDVLRRDSPTDETIGEYLEREGYSSAFRDDYLIPMTAAIWSTSPDKWNHHLLSTVSSRPQWLTIKDGSKTYIDKIMMGFPSNHVRLNTRVTRLISERDGRVRLHTHSGKSEVFDHVILATHGDQAYQIIRDSATDEEHEILRHFLTSKNVAVLHSDISLMPTSRKAWSAWNYLAKSSSPNLKKQTGNITQVCLTYDMNALQHIPRNIFGKVLVTINPLHEPDPTTVQGRYIYRHPLYTPAAVKAQRRLNEIQNKRGISYAGAWTGPIVVFVVEAIFTPGQTD
ncbi:uncharacterized protein CTHT_0008670 [Thermochaetoides thermophila DSM 1495]|uniref:Amine oxidase domain-containing protein n=1 Tax=Chaetomium thermophilum (strain DSM 1495 / CBS 144.50 / IMI 039719) TaxID=759272 RepID=G0S043_CHATD|nr:hypothetical protein CTHT_0008670 [Thermochaetoides thermophila DSM 1495]EGS23204.1 hypothetical protein CTHT_0008670 [Thermochaetoides thermophila DSM 1495]